MKRINYIVLAIISLFIGIINFNAFSISAPTTVYVGESISVKVEATNLAGLFTVYSSDTSVVSGSFSDWIENETKTISFTANSAGWATITVNAANVSDNQENEFTGSRSVSINVINRPAPQPQPTYTYTPPTYYYTKSANNNLSSIGVEGATISPEFDSGTTEYEVLMPAGTTEINVLATKEDDRSTIAGDGKREVSDGPNSIEVIVTSESGLSKTYTLIVTVEEEALPVRFDGHDYTFIRKSNNLPSVSSYYGVTKTIYNDIEVPAYYSEVTNLTLVGLKDTKGKSYLYIYDSQTHAFKKYDEINLGNIAVYTKTLNKKDMIEDLKETVLKINGYEYNAYQFNLDSNYYLVYGTNANTNNTGWFMYDSEENTLQRYNMSEVINLTKQRDKLFIVIKLLGTICILAIIFMIFMGKLLEKKEI